ncbi:MAG: hypothetical protein ABEJ55_00250 [Halanaeroarchaeum sp.]
MSRPRRLPLTTTVLGAWSMMVGTALLFLANRLVSLVPGSVGSGGRVYGSVSVDSLRDVFYGLHDGGASVVVIGGVLLLLGWHRFLARSGV